MSPNDPFDSLRADLKAFQRMLNVAIVLVVVALVLMGIMLDKLL